MQYPRLCPSNPFSGRRCAGCPADSPRTSSGRESSSAPKCVAASDLAAPPAKFTTASRTFPTCAPCGLMRVCWFLMSRLVHLEPWQMSSLESPLTRRSPGQLSPNAGEWQIRDWRYEPSTQNDRPVAVCVTVTVSIHVNRPPLSFAAQRATRPRIKGATPVGAAKLRSRDT
jgi:hypothetical protein